MGRWWILLLAGVLILGWSLDRDIRYSKAYPGDLRYRVVGARLVKDGRLPYFYKWKQGDGFRYYDPDNFDSLKAANITVSPFYLHLLTPIADLPQARIIWIWLVLEYLVLAAMTALGLFLATTTGQKQAVVAIALLFLLTNAWKNHVAEGQTYLLIPALALLFYAGVRRPGPFVRGLAAGVIAGVLLLIRPNTIFFFLPFLFLARRYSRSWWLAFGLPLLLLAGWTLGSQRERALWLDYKHLLQEYVKLNQDLGPATAHNDPDPRFAKWEGIDKPAADSLSLHGIEKVYKENGNVFVLYKLVVHRRLPPVVWEMISIALIAAFGGCFYLRHRSFASVSQLAIFAFCLYMINDLFSPVHRHQYYEVQWLCPLFLAAATAQRRYLPVYVCVIAGLFLGTVHFSFLKMQNTVGEYLILASLLALSLLSTATGPRKPEQASPPVAA